MTEIGYYRYEGFDLQTKFGWINGAVGIQATEPARIGMGNLGIAFGASDQAVRDLLAPLGIEWQGVAAEATAGALRKAADRGGAMGVAAGGGGAAVDGYGQSFEALRPKVAWQDPGTWDWWEMPVDAAGIAFDNVFGDVFDIQSDFTAAIEQNRTLDAQANQALYGHEEQARSALAGFPVVEAAAVPTPARASPAFDVAGPGGPAAGPATVPPFAGAPDQVGVSPAAVAPPGGPVVPPISADAGGPAPGPTPGGLDRTAPGAIPTGTVPSGGPNPAATTAPTPPGQAAPSGIPTAPASRDPAVAPNRQPGRLPEPVIRTTAPSGPGLAPDRASGPGGGPRPAPGPGITPYRPQGDLGQTRQPATGPFSNRVNGGEFASRLPGVTPEQATPGRSAATSTGSPRAVPGQGMPFLGGLGAGSGGAGPTEHRRKYLIPSSEAFDVELPPHTDPVIEGRYG
jgi:hypothetical protein